MAMLLIKGSFRVNGGSKPDGDTLPFIPDDVADWKLVGGRARIVPKADGRVNVRLEGVDALESHYDGTYGPERRQPREFADKAGDELLTWLGFTSVERHEDHTVKTVPDKVPGFILTSGADAYGRCIALVCKGTAPVYSGYEFTPNEEFLKKKTVNHHLVEEGLAYPMFYPGLPGYLRDVLRTAAVEARVAKKGVWDVDRTYDGAVVDDIDSITDTATGQVLLPKLFRRLTDYLDSRTGYSLDGFEAYLAGAADQYRVLPDGKTVTGLHNLITVSEGGSLKMIERTENLLFLDK
ncbi:thermonuclease family protein [Streptomyces pharetrae]|uniref:thermonuclease family protein n=1 Tax=Streptomyces pharetrae TaxID=291370 RepID=UPI003656CA18